MRKFIYFLYKATAVLGVVFFVLAFIYMIVHSVLLELGIAKDTLRGLAIWLGLFYIGAVLLDFGLNGMEKEMRHIAQQTRHISQQPRRISQQIHHLPQHTLKEILSPCQGCQNFHGVEYGGVMLVCGIHPHGVEEDSCPDYELSKDRQGKR